MLCVFTFATFHIRHLSHSRSWRNDLPPNLVLSIVEQLGLFEDGVLGCLSRDECGWNVGSSLQVLKKFSSSGLPATTVR